MLTLDYVKEHLNEIERDDFLDKRFTNRFLDYVPCEEWKDFGYNLIEGAEAPTPKEWTEENILEQFKRDVEFGIEKAINHRGISSELMSMVCLSWLDVLEDKDIDRSLYGYYGSALFRAIDKKYKFGLVDEDTFDDEFYSDEY